MGRHHELPPWAQPGRQLLPLVRPRPADATVFIPRVFVDEEPTTSTRFDLHAIMNESTVPLPRADAPGWLRRRTDKRRT